MKLCNGTVGEKKILQNKVSTMSFLQLTEVTMLQSEVARVSFLQLSVFLVFY